MKRGTDRPHPSSIATPQPTLRPYMIRPRSEDSVNKNSIRSFLALLVFSQLLLVAPGAMAKDQKKLAEEERHRFSLLKAHTDSVIRLNDMSDW